MRLTLRTLGMMFGIVGAGVGFALSLLYSVIHLLGLVIGITPDAPHFLLGVLAALAAVAGALLAVVSGEIGALLLLAAAVAFFFVIGWWAVFPALFLLPAAWLAYRNRASRTRQRAAS